MKRSKPDESEDESSSSDDDGPALPDTAAAARASALAEKASNKKKKDEKRRAKRQKTRTLAHRIIVATCPYKFQRKRALINCDGGESIVRRIDDFPQWIQDPVKSGSEF